MAAKERGVGIVFSTDAQSAEDLEHMEYGVYVARRAGLEALDVVADTRALAQFRRLLKP
jgi:DNA polymerase (family 10)